LGCAAPEIMLASRHLWVVYSSGGLEGVEIIDGSISDAQNKLYFDLLIHRQIFVYFSMKTRIKFTVTSSGSLCFSAVWFVERIRLIYRRTGSGRSLENAAAVT
jgi:hypothetical protein